ncbi:hypothetical protein HMPREF1142_2317 [Peptostreptococcaceae bacterium AS15]|nr:hypothetical protein HMPREF1142_2317 [Peptostreptococcaceae bacterium AS15]
MLKLKGSLRQRIDTAMSIANVPVNIEDLNSFVELYFKANIKLLSSAKDFYSKYGGAFSRIWFEFEDSAYNKEFIFLFYSNLTISELEKIKRLKDTAMDNDMVEQFAGQEVCPVAEIGFYYPACVFIGENSLLYCIHEYEDEIRIFEKPEDILEYELSAHIPIGLTDK